MLPEDSDWLSWDDAKDGLGMIWLTLSKSCTSVGKPTAIPKNSRQAILGQGQDPSSRCPVGIPNVGGGQVPLSCTSVGIPTAIPEDHRQALMGQGHVPSLRCNPADFLNMGKGQDPLSYTSIGKPIAILREHRHAIIGQGLVSL
jgi:hypothetical protein